MFLDDECKLARSALADLAGGLGRYPEVTFLTIALEGHGQGNGHVAMAYLQRPGGAAQEKHAV